MNKTIIININGIVFHIEEDAYELLKSYMTDVKRHFAYSPDSEEIVGDIENRIAEMFSERLADDKKQVIVSRDVEQVTEQMGAVDQFTDTEDRQLAAPAFSERKLFRDTDDRILGGVCSGIGHYFNIEARIVRFIAILSCFAGGSGFLIYVILWIVMPSAKTRADKLAMKGERVNLQNIKRTFDDELEIQNTRTHRNGLDTATDFLRNIVELFGNTFGKILRVLIKIVGGLIILTGCIALIATIIALFVVLGFWSSSELNMFPFNVINPEYQTALYFSAFVLIVIPIIALIFLATRILFDRRVITRIGWFAMLVIWLTGLAVGVYHGARLGAEFSEQATYEQNVPIKPAPAYKLELNEALFFSKEDSVDYALADSGSRKVIVNRDRDEDNMPRNISLSIETGSVAQPVLIEEFSARGSSFKNALNTAKRTMYHFEQMDSILRFDWAARFPRTDSWRNQSVHLKLLLPANTRLLIDGKLNPYLKDYNLEDCLPPDAASEAFSAWTLTETGLSCNDAGLYRRNREDND